MLERKLADHKTKVWLVSTGWTGGKVGHKGSYRIDINHSRAIMDAIHANALDNVKYKKLPKMGLRVPQTCPGVPDKILNPRNTWANKEKYDL